MADPSGFNGGGFTLSGPPVPPANLWRATGTSTATSVFTVVSGTTGLLTYVTSMQISQNGTTPTTLSFNDTGSTQFAIASAGTVGPLNIVFSVPLVSKTVNTSIICTLSAQSTTVIVAAQGYYGT